MYPGAHAESHPDRPALIMASSGETVTYGELEARSNRLAHLLRAEGLERLDHYSILMENHPRYVEACAAGDRAGLYYTCVNSFLTADEVAYILDNSRSQVLITSRAELAVAAAAVAECPRVTRVLVVDHPGSLDGEPLDAERFVDYATAVAEHPDTPIDDEALGVAMLYSSGTTGRPKGILRPLPDQPPGDPYPLYTFLSGLWRYREDLMYLSPAPLYHSAPQVAVNLTIRHGGTAVIMERFDPLEYLQLIGRHGVTHTQLVPTMFSRMLKLPPEDREGHDLSSLEYAVHAAAPCPEQVKRDMIEWWGPIVHEYYGATEAIGFTACDSEEWLAHPGTVGKVVIGVLHVLDDDMAEVPTGEPGTIWFEIANEFEYHDDPEKTADAKSPDGTMASVGDVGYVDDDGYLYLTDRKTFMIISGGVNLYPQETEDLLITHPKVLDAAVIGVPNPDLGEEMKAVVQLMDDVEPGEAITEELLAFCGRHLSRQKVPRSIDYTDELPRLPTGKLYKRTLRDAYWGEATSRILG